jgi:hypothetical protein
MREITSCQSWVLSLTCKPWPFFTRASLASSLFSCSWCLTNLAAIRLPVLIVLGPFFTQTPSSPVSSFCSSMPILMQAAFLCLSVLNLLPGLRSSKKSLKEDQDLSCASRIIFHENKEPSGKQKTTAVFIMIGSHGQTANQ